MRARSSRTISMILYLLMAALFFVRAEALSLLEEDYANRHFVVVEVDLSEDNLQHYWRDSAGQAYGSIQNLNQALQQRGEQLRFAINSGIYAKEERPLGLHIEQGEILTPLNEITSNAGKGNFSLLPNGVFYIDRKGEGKIKRTEAYAAMSDQARQEVLFATQSGPMLLIEGEYNPRFIIDSDSERIRSGVCVKQPTEVIFVVSEDLINFYDFATYFKARLGCQNALYLDGSLARIYYDGRYYGASPFSRLRKLVGVWGVTEHLRSPSNALIPTEFD